MPKLFVIGDSFSFQYSKPDWPIWTTQLAKLLNLELINHSLPGCDQEWILQKVRELPEVDEQDRLIIILTGRSRFWYIKEYPQYSNLICNIDIAPNTLSDNQLKAIENFYRYIWRDDLSKSLQKSKLREMSWIFQNKKINPININSFENEIDDTFLNLKIARGNFTDDLMLNEFYGSQLEKINFIKNYWNNYECRLNHICKVNHGILANELYKCISDNQDIDLHKFPFAKNIITKNNYNDENLASQQFSIIKFQEMRNLKLKKKFFL